MTDEVSFEIYFGKIAEITFPKIIPFFMELSGTFALLKIDDRNIALALFASLYVIFDVRAPIDDIDFKQFNFKVMKGRTKM